MFGFTRPVITPEMLFYIWAQWAVYALLCLAAIVMMSMHIADWNIRRARSGYGTRTQLAGYLVFANMTPVILGLPVFQRLLISAPRGADGLILDNAFWLRFLAVLVAGIAIIMPAIFVMARTRIRFLRPQARLKGRWSLALAHLGPDRWDCQQG